MSTLIEEQQNKETIDDSSVAHAYVRRAATGKLDMVAYCGYVRKADQEQYAKASDPKCYECLVQANKAGLIQVMRLW